MGWSDTSAYGQRAYQTPNIDRLAREGNRFTNFYVPQAVCSASRAALMTGSYPTRVGINGALAPASRIGINDSETLLPEILKARGYATAIFGKWHLGAAPRFLPTRHGFDEYFGIPYSNDMTPAPLMEGETVLRELTQEDRDNETTMLTDRAVRFIDRNKDRPFFLYVPHNMPHVPLAVSSKFKGKTGLLYSDVMLEIDWSVGQIADALKRNGVDDGTLFLFSSDNGPWLIYGKDAGSALPLREGKQTTFEGGHREPFIARWPGHISRAWSPTPGGLFRSAADDRGARRRNRGAEDTHHRRPRYLAVDIRQPAHRRCARGAVLLQRQRARARGRAVRSGSYALPIQAAHASRTRTAVAGAWSPSRWSSRSTTSGRPERNEERVAANRRSWAAHEIRRAGPRRSRRLADPATGKHLREPGRLPDGASHFPTASRCRRRQLKREEAPSPLHLHVVFFRDRALDHGAGPQPITPSSVTSAM